MRKKISPEIVVLIGIAAFVAILAAFVNLPQTSKSVSDLPKLGNAPELAGITGWINTEPFTLAQLRGKVVLVDFWTYSCINCIRTLPYLKAWDEKYRDKGLVIVGVHTPEFGFEKDYNNVVNAVNRYGIKYKVVQDNDYATWRAYKNQYWPRKYLIDINGYIFTFSISNWHIALFKQKIRSISSCISRLINHLYFRNQSFYKFLKCRAISMFASIPGLKSFLYIS